jgi:hypothetical protein
VKAIIISDADARALLAKLELTKLRGDGHIMRDGAEQRPPTLGEIHRVFHYVVCTWLQEQGADVVGR